MKIPFHQLTPAERIAARIAENRRIEERVAQRRTTPLKSLREVKVSFAGKEAVGFSQSDVFPIITSIITKLCGPRNNYIGHREIVDALVEDEGLGWLLNQIVERDPHRRNTKWWANSMMSWFSQRVTEKNNPYADRLERDSDSRPYQYRIKQQ